jgi:hypothetical protein
MWVININCSAYPNLGNKQITVKLESNTNDVISIRVIHEMGKVIEMRSNLTAGQTVQ